MGDLLWYETASLIYNAAEYRQLLYALTGGQQGVFPSTGLTVTQHAGGASATLADFSAGAAFIVDTEVANEAYFQRFTAGTVTVPAQHASTATKHLVGVRVQNSEHSGSTQSGTVVILSGTSGANTDPTTPDNFLPLARITRPGGSPGNTVTTAMITDLRDVASLLPARCLDATRPGSPVTGQIVAVTDLGRNEQWDGTVWRRADAFTVAGRTQVDLTRAANQPVNNNTRTQIFWDGEVTDTDGLHSANAGPIVMTDDTEGTWSINVTCDWDADASVNQWLEIEKDGVTPWRFGGGQSGGQRLSGAVTTKISSGIGISVYVAQTSGSQRQITTGRIEMARIGR